MLKVESSFFLLGQIEKIKVLFNGLNRNFGRVCENQEKLGAQLQVLDRTHGAQLLIWGRGSAEDGCFVCLSTSNDMAD